MPRMSVVQLGVVVFALCLSTQVVSQSSSNSTAVNSTTNPNTTMAPGTYSSPTNATTPTGAGILLHADKCSLLIPIIMAASLVQCYC